MRKGFIIAIDGPVASGKGTISPIIADALHGFYLYTGAMYRCLALYCIEQHIDSTDIAQVITAAKTIVMQFDGSDISLSGVTVTERIKQRDVAMLSSELAIIDLVRIEMNRRQQEIALEKIGKGIPVIVEGRDIGTTIFPNAQCKIFLTATPQVRARRRLAQMLALGNNTASYEAVLQDTLERDKRDTMRSVSPLVTNPEQYGYTIVTDTLDTREQTIQVILDILTEKGLYDSH